jgi:hypothetical protein
VAAASFEDHSPAGPEELAELAAARGALDQGIIAHLLELFKAVSARFA